MIKSVRVAATAALAVSLLAAVFAAPANAEHSPIHGSPDEVTVTAEVKGNEVEFIVTNNSSRAIACWWNVFDDKDQGGHPRDGWSRILRGGEKELRLTATVDDGSYQIIWMCETPSGTDREWGSWDFENKTAEPFRFTTPFVPDDGGTDDGEGGTGSPGSLDFGSLGGS
ncbi:hypothetical protein [Rhodococcus sp. NPDC049939]|uniref:hypothetical protein n=1 Tax=Rhodococcus sp. NPDC049939 TaxID=3155511 RepID=UPI00340B77E5